MICSVVGSAEHSGPCIKTNDWGLCKIPTCMKYHLDQKLTFWNTISIKAL